MSYPLSPSLVSNHTPKDSRRRRIHDHSGPCLSPSRHWEVELWRRSQSITSRLSESSIPASSSHPNISPPSPTLPSSPTAFDLDLPLPSSGSPGRSSIITPRRQDPSPGPASSPDLDQLRLDALTELQKSVVEKGEGFVDKMRHWETNREQESMADRGLKRSRSMMAHMTSDPMDDADDVMILDSPLDEDVHRWESSRKKRALSANIMDALDAAPSAPTPPTLTDDDTESSSRDSISAVPASDTSPYPDIPSYSDKAVSALTLAFANGACGINDYQAVLDAYSCTHYGEESHAGELWD